MRKLFSVFPPDMVAIGEHHKEHEARKKLPWPLKRLHIMFAHVPPVEPQTRVLQRPRLRFSHDEEKKS